MTDTVTRRLTTAAVIGCGLLMLLVIGAMLVSWRVRVDADHDRRVSDHQRCLTTNESRKALRDAFHDDHEKLDALLGSVVGSSENGRAFVERLTATHIKVEQRLADKLPIVDCGR